MCRQCAVSLPQAGARCARRAHAVCRPMLQYVRRAGSSAVEQRSFKPTVVGSIPTRPTTQPDPPPDTRVVSGNHPPRALSSPRLPLRRSTRMCPLRMTTSTTGLRSCAALLSPRSSLHIGCRNPPAFRPSIRWHARLRLAPRIRSDVNRSQPMGTQRRLLATNPSGSIR